MEVAHDLKNILDYIRKIPLTILDNYSWTILDIYRENASLYLNILGYGVGGNKSLVDGKNKTSEKPEWWDDANNFDMFTHPSKAKLRILSPVF